MRLTAARLIKAGCCKPGVSKYFKGLDRKAWDAEKLLTKTIEDGQYQDAAYGMAYLMTQHQRVEWSVWAVERTIGIYEDAGGGLKPRQAIAGLKGWLKDSSTNLPYISYTSRYGRAAGYAIAAVRFAIDGIRNIPDTAMCIGYVYTAKDFEKGKKEKQRMAKKLLHKGAQILLRTV